MFNLLTDSMQLFSQVTDLYWFLTLIYSTPSSKFLYANNVFWTLYSLVDLKDVLFEMIINKCRIIC